MLEPRELPLDNGDLPGDVGVSIGAVGLNVNPYLLRSSSNSAGVGSLPCNSYTTLLPSICGVLSALLSDSILLTAVE
jgi:hypothetical protein